MSTADGRRLYTETHTAEGRARKRTENTTGSSLAAGRALYDERHHRSSSTADTRKDAR